MTTNTTADDGDTRRPVVVGVDLSEGSKHALRWAADLAERLNAGLDVVSAWMLPAGYGWDALQLDWDPAAEREQWVTEMVDEVLGTARPVDLNVLVYEAAAARLLIELSEQALMIVVGSRGLGGFTGLLLGSVSAKVAEHARCPVLVVHGENG